MDTDSASPAGSSLTGCAIVTGANGSMGLEISKKLVLAGYHVVMACRSVDKGLSAAQKAGLNNVTVLPLDLSSFHSIGKFVDMVSQQFQEVKVLVNNAGIISRSHSLTEEGYENTVAVNFIGTALLTRRLIHMMSQGARIIMTVSLTTRFGHVSRKLLYGNKHSFNRLAVYSNSKRALLLYTVKLAEEEKHLHVYAVDPGVVNTGIISMGNWLDPIADKIFRPFIKSAEQGASTAAGLATGELSGNALLWRGCRPRKLSKRILNHPKKDTLYDFIETLV